MDNTVEARRIGASGDPVGATTGDPAGEDVSVTVDDRLSATERLRYEQEIRRLRRDLELREQVLRDLGRRLHEAEIEAATAGGRVVAEARAAFEERAVTAEARLAELQRTKLFRLAAPLRTAYGRARRGGGLAGRLLGR